MNKYSGKINSMDFKPQVLGEQVSQILIDAILEGSLKQGDQLIEVDLQKHFNVSCSPLREAFRELEKKGLVEIIPRKGAFVRTVTTKDIKEKLTTPLILVGGVRSLQLAEKLYDEGYADYFSMSRPFIREPGLVAR